MQQQWMGRHCDGLKELNLIDRISHLRISSLPFAAPKRVSQTTEQAVVRDVLQALQGHSTFSLPWDEEAWQFHVRNGVYVAHLSQSSLRNILKIFSRAATSLRRVEHSVRSVLRDTNNSWLRPISQAYPTLEAFANALFMRLESLRKDVLEMELEAATAEGSTRVTLLSLSANLSRLFAGAEFLEHIVKVAVPEPHELLESKVSAAELATHIISALYKELDAFCLLQDGEEYAYKTALLLLVGSIRPMIESLDSLFQEGILSDPAGELFFYKDASVTVEDSAFWETHFHLRVNQNTLSEQDSRFNSPFQSPGSQRDSSFSVLESTSPSGSTRGFSGQKFLNTSIDSTNTSVHGDSLQSFPCPNFLKPLGKAILSAGKSLQLLHYARRDQNLVNTQDIYGSSHILPDVQILGREFSDYEGSPGIDSNQLNSSYVPVGENLSLYDQFCASLLKLLGETSIDEACKLVFRDTLESHKQGGIASSGDELWEVILGSRELRLGCLDAKRGTAEHEIELETSCLSSHTEVEREFISAVSGAKSSLHHDLVSAPAEKNGICPVNALGGAAVIFARTEEIPNEKILRGWLNLAGYCQLSALDDAQLRGALFASNLSQISSTVQEHLTSMRDGNSECMATDFNGGLGCGRLLLHYDKQNFAAMERLLPFPTILPNFQEKCHVSKQLPFRSANRRAVRVLQWLQTESFKTTPAPTVLFQECLTAFLQKQIDRVGQQLLAKLMGEWRLMEELALLRAIYLVGSGDLLQQFASVLFNKLDRGEPWDDFYELNTMLQESVRSSSHGVAIPALDSLVATVLPRSISSAERGSGQSPSSLHIGGRAPSFGIDTLDSLYFTYKVAWPLELIIDSSATKKYNQVMIFLLKVKRAKHALDKACRLTWKNGVGDAVLHKQRLLLQQKLMHFVNTLHQYVMDRVLYSAWVELSEGMSSAGSLDEVKSCHDSYLISIQRQCLVAPDKLWTLIASRVKTILGLALNYYSIQRVLCDGVGASAVGARCQLEIERVEKQFDECLIFLIRVLSFKLNVGHFPHLADLPENFDFVSNDKDKVAYEHAILHEFA
ncbi:hypothetical protein R1flu_022782 [Riccia fluitans]|uniref:Gamma-tubulin complex component n=1 Tax=Riccia fluitans TaxID=41844 RepID=A0ABD1XQ58_9MARC